MAVVGLQYSLERQRQSLAERAERLGNFLASTFAVSVGVEQIAIAAAKDKARVEENIRSAVEDQLNRCLSELRLFEDADVVASATRLERKLTDIVAISRTRTWSREAWRAQRSELARLTDDYEAIARRKLRRRKLDAGLGFYAAEGDIQA